MITGRIARNMSNRILRRSQCVQAAELVTNYALFKLHEISLTTQKVQF